MDPEKLEEGITIILGCVILILMLTLILLPSEKYKPIVPIDARIIVFAPHPDDEIAIAGGRLIQNNGESFIVYLTDGCYLDVGKEICTNQRRHEAIKALNFLGINSSHFIFLGYQDKFGFIDKDNTLEAIAKVRDIIVRLKPDEVYIPTYEGGNCIHDITNYIVSEAVRSLPTPPIMIEAPEYNDFISQQTPNLIFRKLATRVFQTFFPFHPFRYPTQFLPQAQQPLINQNGIYLELLMSSGELNMKRAAISFYVSQNLKLQLTEKFSFKDRYRIYPGYNYSMPPYRLEDSYGFKLCKIANFFRGLVPGLGKRDCNRYGKCDITFEDYRSWFQ